MTTPIFGPVIETIDDKGNRIFAKRYDIQPSVLCSTDGDLPYDPRFDFFNGNQIHGVPVGPSIVRDAILHITATGRKEVEIFEGMNPIGILHNFKISNLYRDRKARGRRRHQFFMTGKHNKKRPEK
jgi:hypothetical protein